MNGEPFLLEEYADREGWLKARTFGGSDAAVACGEGYVSPFAWWVGKVKGLDVSPLGRRGRFGRFAEAFIEDEAAKQILSPLFDPGDFTIFRSKTHPWRHATLDRLVLRNTLASPTRSTEDHFALKNVAGAGEFKTVGIGTRQHWTDQPAKDAWIQVQHNLDVTGLDMAFVAALFGAGEDFGLWVVPADKRFGGELLEAEEKLWRSVAEGIPPPVDAHPTTRRALDQLYSEARSGEVVVAGKEWEAMLRDYIALEAKLSAYERTKDEIGNAFRQKMASAERMLIEGVDDLAVTWKTQQRGDSSFRVLRVAKR